jgi:hypothetical protein
MRSLASGIYEAASRESNGTWIRYHAGRMPESVSLVALERMRTAARERIGDGYARDLIDADELDRRLEALERASTAGEVEALVADLALDDGAP